MDLRLVIKLLCRGRVFELTPCLELNVHTLNKGMGGSDRIVSKEGRLDFCPTPCRKGCQVRSCSLLLTDNPSQV